MTDGTDGTGTERARLTTGCNAWIFTLSRPSTPGSAVSRSPEQVTTALAAATARRHDLHAAMVRGELSVDRYRELAADESTWIDTLLDRLLDARTDA